jgi:hypothetical protein
MLERGLKFTAPFAYRPTTPDPPLYLSSGFIARKSQMSLGT